MLTLSLIGRTALAGPPAAAPCEDGVSDPIATPLHEAGLDAQRGACLRDDFEAATVAHALIDPDDFHGLLGGELAIGGHVRLRPQLELGARIRAIDYAFAQTAVTKASRTAYGPLAFGVAYNRVGGRAAFALALSAELPFSRDDMDTLRTSGGAEALVTGELARTLRLHARLGTFAATATSDGGTTEQLGLRAGVDLVWQLAHTVGLSGGAEVQAGWYGSFDALLVRAGVQKRWGNYRGQLGVGVPLGGASHTTALLTVGLVRDI